ncbi:MAG: single-stranded-DNA-specific exonuclease RecJ [Oscillospiraceae bacterium]|nr:single-stranded-DNA-specific exonuclease RecJ [Oscillospiraceae bacterium]
MSRKMWTLPEFNKDLAASLAEDCGIDPFVALLLAARGCKTPEEAERFLCVGEVLEDPFALRDMDKAVECINRAVDDFERICVYGDYDADGVTATAIVYSYLESQGANVAYYIPSRMEEGYGLCEEAVEKLYAEGTGLIITVDNGISAHAAASRAAELGIKLIVTDHHRPGEVLPEAVAVIDPHRADDGSAFHDLAGVGVALKLVAALEGGDYEAVLEDFADIAALGTIADIVPLVSENRVLALRGLAVMNNGGRCGIEALREKSGMAEKVMNATGIAFGLAPRINAAGRMGNAERAVRLLLTEDVVEAQHYAEEIHEVNALRHETENEILASVERGLRERPESRYDKVLVVDGENWHQGVIGIVASRLVERYARPVIVISRESDGIGKGSGRSIDGFSLFDALRHVSDMLLHFGGHTLAAGFSIAVDKIEDFRRAVNDYALTQPDVLPRLALDFRLHPSQINLNILDSLTQLEPFGAGNPMPLFGLYHMTLKTVKPTNNGKHVTLTACRGEAFVFAVKFGADADTFPFKAGDVVDLAVRLDRNEYMGEAKVSVQVVDIRFSDWDGEVVAKNYVLYDKIKRGEALNEKMRAYACPDRELITRIYRFVREKGVWHRGVEALAFRLSLEARELCRAIVALDALCELGILREDEDGAVCAAGQSQKVDLANAGILHTIGYQ